MHFDTGDGGGPTRRDEENYWQTLRTMHEQEDENVDDEFLTKAKYYRVRLAELNKEKMELERRALEVHRAISREHTHLEELTVGFQEKRNEIRLQRQFHHHKMTAWFGDQRRKENEEHARIAAAALAAPRRDVQAADPQSAAKAANGTNGVSINGEQRGGAQTSTPNPARADFPALTMIIDASGHLVGPVNRIPLSNKAIAVLSELPQKRPVQLRPDAPFSQDDLMNLTEVEHKWVGTVVQATGTVRKPSQQCTQCSNGQGPFTQCVILDMPEFRACGNCIWQRANCCVEASAAEQAPSIMQFRPHNIQDIHNDHLADDGFTNGTATPLSLSRPGSRDKSMAAGSTATDETEEDLTPITRANLTLKHDGEVFTHPECMEGVPVNKIDPSHPYWDPSWPEIAPSIEPTLQSWRDKLQAALDKGQTSMRFQLGRQVNRGETILKFLSDANFCPYQLVAKKYMMPRLVSYDTIFRLADTLRTLEGFKTLDITPLEWLRQRLQEIIITDGPEFNLAKTIHDFYHDPKYVALRLANGKKSIGRPSGMKMTPKDSPGSAKNTPNTKKRKLFISEEFPGPSQRPLAPTPTHQYATRPDSQPQDSEAQQSVPSTPELSRASKKFKTRVPGKARDQDLNYDGFTDTDDYSGDNIGKHDWALGRIKSRLNTVSNRVTQYWHWIPDDGEQIFEHQVLAEGDTFTWGIYAKPINFHLELEHVQEMRWAADTTKVIVVCKEGVVISPDGKPRGDLLAEFKRERTKRRFLVFCRKQGIELVKVEADAIEKAWDEYESPDVPAMPDSEID
ncbi:hypothetical protein EsH8_IV_000073 [Colletotrichum jinshuiense]